MVGGKAAPKGNERNSDQKKRDPRHSISSGTDKETPPLISCSILNEENVMNSIRIYHDRKLKIPLDSRVKVNKWGLH